MKFSKERMLEVLNGNEGEIIEDEIYKNSRWAIQHALIFRLDDKVCGGPVTKWVQQNSKMSRLGNTTAPKSRYKNALG